MLELNPVNRPSVDELLENPWFAKALTEVEYNRVLSIARANAVTFIRGRVNNGDPFAGQGVFRGAGGEDHPDTIDRDTLPATYDPKDEQYKSKDLLESRYGPALGVLDLVKDFAKSLKYDYFKNDACFKDLIVENSKSEEGKGL